MPKKRGRKSITAYSADGEPVMEVYAIKRDGNKLVIDGKALGSMSLDVIVSADEIAQGLGIVMTGALFGFLLRMPAAVWRNWRGKKDDAAKSKAKD